MAITSDTIHQQTFKERFKGYDEEEVDQFLAEVADGIGELHREREELTARIAELESGGAVAGAEEPSGLTETERLLRKTLVTAQRTADDTVAEARAQAEQTLADAREEAETTLTEARREAEQLLERARAQAAEDTDLARSERERIRQAVDDLRRLRAEYAERVRAVIAEQLDLLDRTGDLPDLPPSLEGLGDLDPVAGPADNVSVDHGESPATANKRR